MEINKVGDTIVNINADTKEFEETLNKINKFNIQMENIKHSHK